MFLIKIIFINITLSFILASENFFLKPIAFVDHVSEGDDYVISKRPVTLFGAGIKAFYKNNQWTINTEYIQLGLFGDIDETIFSFSPRQSFPYLDDSKDADGYWSEYATAKIQYTIDSFEINFGKFDRQWGYGQRFIQISDKAPSYPQVGLKWNIKENLTLVYFHGFLSSGISDTSQSIHYNNSRFLKVPRNIAAHRITWKPSENITIGLNESVIYATRIIDPHYLIPFLPLYPIENYLGDTDNLQMGFDAEYLLNQNNKLYFSFFMDELTPEWIFSSKNHNWFAWQFGFNANNIFFNSETIYIEYNWTDQRIYKHKFSVNNYYSHEQPLGYWAGPHAQEFLINYKLIIKNNTIFFEYHDVKRGLSTRSMVVDNYIDKQAKRFENGSEKKQSLNMFLEQSSKINGLFYRLGLSYVKFTNVGFSLSDIGISNKKLTLRFGINYNFRN